MNRVSQGKYMIPTIPENPEKSSDSSFDFQGTDKFLN